MEEFEKIRYDRKTREIEDLKGQIEAWRNNFCEIVRARDYILSQRDQLQIENNDLKKKVQETQKKNNIEVQLTINLYDDAETVKKKFYKFLEDYTELKKLYNFDTYLIEIMNRNPTLSEIMINKKELIGKTLFTFSAPYSAPSSEILTPIIDITLKRLENDVIRLEVIGSSFSCGINISGTDWSVTRILNKYGVLTYNFFENVAIFSIIMNLN